MLVVVFLDEVIVFWKKGIKEFILVLGVVFILYI